MGLPKWKQAVSPAFAGTSIQLKNSKSQTPNIIV
jgi:hypothetical protein